MTIALGFALFTLAICILTTYNRGFVIAIIAALSCFITCLLYIGLREDSTWVFCGICWFISTICSTTTAINRYNNS